MIINRDREIKILTKIYFFDKKKEIALIITCGLLRSASVSSRSGLGVSESCRERMYCGFSITSRCS